METHRSHITGTLGENEFAVIDGVEATYRKQDQHLLLAGLPIDQEIDAYNIGREEFFDSAEDAAWSGIPHWNFMTPSADEKEEIVHEADDLDDVDIALSHNGGYGTFSRYINDELPGTGESEIQRMASEYELAVIPEIDSHVTLPRGMEHAGLMRSGTMDQLRNGKIPVKDILDANTVNYGYSGKELVDDWNFGATQVAPSLADGNGFSGSIGSLGQFTVGYSRPEDYRQKMKSNVSAVAGEVDSGTLKEKAGKLYD